MMSPSSAVIVLSFFLLTFTAKPLVSVPISLRDTNGDKVLVGQDYIIRSLFWGAGEGGIVARPGLNSTCPVDVVWKNGLSFRGTPVRFSPVTDINGVVNTDTNLNIKFSRGSLFGCNQSTIWRVSHYKPWARKWFVTTDGIEGEFGPETYPNWFRIEKVAGTCDNPVYKLVHCPSKNIKALCSDVGIDYDYGGRLVLSNTYFNFKIAKVRKVAHSQE